MRRDLCKTQERQCFAKMPEAVFMRSTHQLPFAFFVPSRELMGEDINTASREEREAAKCDGRTSGA